MPSMILSHLPTIIHSKILVLHLQCARRPCFFDSSIISMQLQCLYKSRKHQVWVGLACPCFVGEFGSFTFAAMMIYCLWRLLILVKGNQMTFRSFNCISVRSCTPTSMIWNGFMRREIFFQMPILISVFGVMHLDASS